MKEHLFSFKTEYPQCPHQRDLSSLNIRKCICAGKKITIIVMIFIFMASVFVGSALFNVERKPDSKITTQKITEAIAQLDSDSLSGIHLPFIENKGQVEDDIAFYANTFAGTVYVTQRGVTYSLIRDSLKAEDSFNQTEITEKFQSGRSLHSTGLERTRSIVNLYLGKQENWYSHLPTYKTVSLGEIWPSIDVELNAYGRNVEKIFKVRPGGNVNDINIAFEGVKSLKISDNGELLLETDLGTIVMTKPFAFQNVEAVGESVDASYHIKGNSYGFTIENYDPEHTLFIDPLIASTFIGDHNNQYGNAIGLDSSGNVFVAGKNVIPARGSPVGEQTQAAVWKLSGDLTTLIATSILGGRGTHIANGLVLDSSENVLITGTTSSSYWGGTFPIVSGSYDTFQNGMGSAFVSKLDNNDLTLLASTYVELNTYEAFGIALDGFDNVFITGTNWHETGDAFVHKLNNDLTALLSSITIGGSKKESAKAIAIDGADNVFIAGRTTSNDIPTTAGAYNELFNGGNADAFITKLNSDLTSILSCTYIGGSSFGVYDYEEIKAIDLDASGNIFVTGITAANDFPTTAGAYNTFFNGGNNDAFLSKLSNDLTSLLASTYIGGTEEEEARAIKIGADSVIITGWTISPNFPTTPGAYDVSFNQPFSLEPSDAFVSKLALDLRSLSVSTFIGGYYSSESINAIALNSSGDIFIAGYSSTPGNIQPKNNYPTTPGAHSEVINGGVIGFETHADAVVSHLSSDLAGTPPVLEVIVESMNINEGDVVEGELATFTIGPTDSISDRKIDWGDGVVQSGGYVSIGAGTVSGYHKYRDNGIFTAEICITSDQTGLTACSSFEVVSANIAPDVYYGGIYQAFQFGSPGKILFLFKDPGSDDTHSAVVDWGDGTTDSVTDLIENLFSVKRVICPHVYEDIGSFTVHITVTDDDGGVGSNTLEIKVIDNVPPVIKVPNDFVVEATGPSGASVTYTVTAEDNVDGSITPVCSPPSGSIFPLGITTVNCSATDSSGNEAKASFTVTVKDTTPPALTPPGNITIEGNTAGGATGVDLGRAIVSDVVDPSPELANDAPSFFPLGETVVTWIAKDFSGNSTIATQRVTVVDTTPPEISIALSPDVLWPPNHKMVPIAATVEVMDICDPSPSVILTSVLSNEPDDAAGNGDGNTQNDIQAAAIGSEDYEFQLRAERSGEGSGRIYQIVYTVTDASGNRTSRSAMVTVPHDKK